MGQRFLVSLCHQCWHFRTFTDRFDEDSLVKGEQNVCGGRKGF